MIHGVWLVRDHIVPRSLGGSDKASNGQKGARLVPIGVTAAELAAAIRSRAKLRRLEDALAQLEAGGDP